MEVVPLEPEIIHNRTSHIAKNAVWDVLQPPGTRSQLVKSTNFTAKIC